MTDAEAKAAEIARDDAPPVTDLIEYLEASSARLLALDSGSGEGRAMRDAALRIKALLSMLSDEQDAAVKARNEAQALRHALTEVSSQTIPGDLAYGADMEEDWDGGDWEGGFCILVRRARAALDSLDQAESA